MLEGIRALDADETFMLYGPAGEVVEGTDAHIDFLNQNGLKLTIQGGQFSGLFRILARANDSMREE